MNKTLCCGACNQACFTWLLFVRMMRDFLLEIDVVCRDIALIREWRDRTKSDIKVPSTRRVKYEN